MNDWDPRENPLVQRAFRTGFRSGPGSYRLGWWMVALGAILVIPLAIQASVPDFEFEESLELMFIGIEILLAMVFVIGGFQRMLTSFSKERERGTFNFLHLSTLRSTGIVLGFLMAGQLPGYLAMVLLVPLLALLAVMTGFNLGILLILLFCLVFYILVLSILFLYLGFWTKKASEFRGAAVVYILLALLFGSIAREGLVSMGILPAGWGEIFLGVPLISELHSIGSSEGALPAPSVVWFGMQIPSWCAAVITFVPLAAILFSSLCASLRHRERPSWSLLRSVLFLGWISVVVVGAWEGQLTSLWDRWLMYALLAWIVILRLVTKNCPSRTQTVQDLGRLKGDWRALLRDQHGPPFLRTGVLLAIVLFVSVWIGWGGNPSEGNLSPLQGLGVGLAIVLPLIVTVLVHQWVTWRTPSLRILVLWGGMLVIWVPFGVYAIAEDNLWIGRDFALYYGGLSPFSQILAAGRSQDSPDQALGQYVYVVQAGYFLIALLAARGCWVGGRSAERAAQIMLRGDDPESPAESTEPGAAPAL